MLLDRYESSSRNLLLCDELFVWRLQGVILSLNNGLFCDELFVWRYQGIVFSLEFSLFCDKLICFWIICLLFSILNKALFAYCFRLRIINGLDRLYRLACGVILGCLEADDHWIALKGFAFESLLNLSRTEVDLIIRSPGISNLTLSTSGPILPFKTSQVIVLIEVNSVEWVGHVVEMVYRRLAIRVCTTVCNRRYR